MTSVEHDEIPFLRTMADGTTKQVNPITGTQVWTVPGRGDRPLGVAPATVEPLTASDLTTSCAFCADRYLETPPEKVRSVRADRGTGPVTTFERRRSTTPEEALTDRAEFRRVPNLFEIMSVDYWQTNHGFEFPAEVTHTWRTYVEAPGGRDHLLRLVRARLGSRAAGLNDDDLLVQAEDFFASTHDVVVARRHYVDGATTSDQLASSGTLTPIEHREYLDLTIDAMAELYAANPHIRYVAAFQNWLKPAGASFDHLHKQIVGIDELGARTEADVRTARESPTRLRELTVDHARRAGLVIAENDHAVAFAGFGHRYPSIEVWSTHDDDPWQLTADARHGMADLLREMHAATGADVPCNEEWHHRPPEAGDIVIPWHVVLKWRISNLAGFEGGTSIYLNTVSPAGVRERVLSALR